MKELVYGQLPHRDEYSLLDKEAGNAQRKAYDCSTWGDYARLAGLNWNEFVEGFRASIAGSHHIGDLIQDARLAASEALPSDLSYSEDPVLRKDLQIGGGSPGPNINTVTADVEAASEQMTDVADRATS